MYWHSMGTFVLTGMHFPDEKQTNLRIALREAALGRQGLSEETQGPQEGLHQVPAQRRH